MADMPKQIEKQKRENLSALVGEQVLHTLGEPGALHKIQVRRLWDNHYRVNVLIGPDAATARISNSFFVEADGEGKIVKASPAITKQY